MVKWIDLQIYSKPTITGEQLIVDSRNLATLERNMAILAVIE